MNRAFLRSPDSRFDGYQVDADLVGGEFLFGWDDDNRRFFRHDVRCGTTSWIEFWEDGYIPPGHDVEEKPKRGRR